MNMETNTTVRKGPHVVVLGNEKGGSGKSTTAMHLALSLIEEGAEVATIDLDSRQRSLTRYVENRVAFMDQAGVELYMPEHRVVMRSEEAITEAAEADERTRLHAVLEEVGAKVDVIVIDCPGSDVYLSRLAHSFADTLVTPMNDSFIDLDLLARVDPDTLEIISASQYSEMIWEARKRRAMRDKGKIDWIVIRNRIQSLDARTMREIRTVLGELSRRVGFRVVPGFGERVIYKELFLKGLTLLDLKMPGVRAGEEQMTMSQVAARQELRDLTSALGLRIRRTVDTGLRDTA